MLKTWCHAKVDHHFIAAMEEVLDLYEHGVDDTEVLICFDERPLIHAQTQIEKPLSNILIAMGFDPFHHRVLEPTHILMQLKPCAKVSRALPSIAKRISQSPSYTSATPRHNWEATPDLNLRVY